MFYRNIEYYRICRTWDYKKNEIQRYVRVGDTAKERKASLIEAKLIDELLQQQQVVCKSLKVNNGELYFQASGKIVGINRVFYKNSKPPFNFLHEFSVRFNPKRINTNSKKPIRCTSVGIDYHGLKTAYEIAVEKMAMFAEIEHNKPLIDLMLTSFKYYSFDPSLKINQKYVNSKGKYDPNEKMLDSRLHIDFNEVAEKTGIATLNKIEKNLLKELQEYQAKNPTDKKNQSENIDQW